MDKLMNLIAAIANKRSLITLDFGKPVCPRNSDICFLLVAAYFLFARKKQDFHVM